MKRLFISSFGITFLAAGSALAQYNYSAPVPYGETGRSFFPSTTSVVMVPPDEALSRLRARVPEAAGLPGQGSIRLRAGALDKAVNCGTVDALYPDRMSAQLSGIGKLPAATSAQFMAWRPDGPPVMAEAATDVEAEATIRVTPENGGAASRITVDIAYRVTRSLTLDGAAQPPVTVTFSSGSYGQAPAATPITAMHPVGFGVAPLTLGMNAVPFAPFSCIASGVLEKALLLEETRLTADQTCMLGLPPGNNTACPRVVARAGTSATLADAPAAPVASGAPRPPR